MCVGGCINIFHIKVKSLKITHIFCKNIYFIRPCIFKNVRSASSEFFFFV